MERALPAFFGEPPTLDRNNGGLTPGQFRVEILSGLTVALAVAVGYVVAQQIEDEDDE